MICYRDQCYCASACINTECFRYLSDEVKSGAEKCGLPIATATDLIKALKAAEEE